MLTKMSSSTEILLKQMQKVETNIIVETERNVFSTVLFHVIKLKYFLLTLKSLSN